MRINTNVSALNAANNLGRVQAEASESMAKLSSGFRINKAADDAAGLGIANKLRADTRALSQASRNAEQTNSLLQVAEGSTATIQKMLERMKELATQSGSDTVDAAGRGRINSEFTALRSEIDRTVNTTKFQGNALLDGTFGSTAPQLAASDITTTGGVASTALGGAYTVAVSSTGIATLNRPAGAVPPTYSIDLNAPTAGQVTYAAGKATLHFGTVGGNDEVKVAATAASASDVAGIQTALDQHGFSLSAAVATTATAGTTSIAGATGLTLPASQASGTLHFQVTDAAIAASSGLTASSYITASSLTSPTTVPGAYTLNVVSTNALTSGGTLAGTAGISAVGTNVINQAAGSYVVTVTDQNATVSGTGNTLTGVLGSGATAPTVASSNVAGTYTVKMSGSNLQVFRGATQVGTNQDMTSATWSSDIAISTGGVSFTIKASTYANAGELDTALGASGKSFNVTGSASIGVTLGGVAQGTAQDISTYDGSADISVSTGGIQFTIDRTAMTTAAAVKTGVNTKTATVVGEVRTLTLKDSANATVGAAQDFKSFATGVADIAFSQGGFNFTIDKSITKGNISSLLDSRVLTVSAAKIDLKDASNTTIATQSLAGYSAGSDVAFSNNSYGITFAGGNAATNTYANLKTTLNNSASTISATQTAAASAAASAITGNGQTGTNASFLVDSSGAYKTNDIIQLAAIDLRGSTLGLSTMDLSTAGSARNALATIDTAISTVSTALGSIGANQNRISYAQDNLKTKINNFSAAESVIRDVDMADEMTKFSKSNILAQAGTAMLAQANQAAQGVLQLLRG
jgi:flagellin